ncbi:MAG: heme-binding protein [Nocardioidaceae bacterium]
MRLTLAQAQAVIAVALEHAEARGIPSAVAVVDEGGNTLAFAAHEDAILAARDLAIAKAYTSLCLRADSGDLDQNVQPGGLFFGLNTALNNRPLVTFDGGRPLRDPNGRVVGAVGVSGGTLEDDATISAAAIAAFSSRSAEDQS